MKNKAVKNIEYIEGGRELLDEVKPLWEKLNRHHGANSEYFKRHYEKQTFESRSTKFKEGKDELVKIDLVRDNADGSYIGYCISTLGKELTGEIDSLYIDEAYRGLSIGDALMRRAIDWLDLNNAKTKIIAVAEGNEHVLEFYKRHGFYKRRTILEEVRTEHKPSCIDL